MLETKRCTMKTFQKSDYDDMKKLYTNQEVRKFLGGVRQEESIEAALDEMLMTSDDCYYWTVREKHTDNFMGLVSLDPHHDGEYLEISYQFLPHWWGKGYAKEAVQLVINFGFNELSLSKIIAETQTANISSCKLLERAGMELEQTMSRFGAEQAIYSIKPS
ncbi:GNAT family N-acetyltransferase [Oceanobacillus neutriphilus]|uniref:Acetyltransferase n=1 Tax=Oceanobacillus neutriphilus TaxID=531815 RepID=A0ABQ2NUV3_9BACI|nr:GNAT family N-acetyltransferase [Oceanobacillus neutriphilus]GGP11036.1 acetyltransferase [Oceanobacillus neutriphilus]